MEKFISFAIILLIADHIYCQVVTPSCMTVSVRSLATFNINVDNDKPFKIKRFEKTIYNSGSPAINIDTTKYAITPLNNRQYQFIIKDVAVEDGTSYYLITDTDKGYNFQLIVIDHFIPIIIPSGYLQLNQPISINCTFTFYGPGSSSYYDNPLTEEQTPSLSLLIGVGDNVKEKELPIIKNAYIWKNSQTIIYNITTSTELYNNDVICKVKSKEPLFYIENRNIIEIIHPTDHVNISDNLVSIRQQGQKVNCSANGYPFPTVRWVPVTVPNDCSTFNIVNNERVSTLTINCLGPQTWNCTAVYSHAKMVSLGTPYSFTVGPTNPGSNDNNKNNTDFWNLIPNPFGDKVDIKTAAIGIAAGAFALIATIISTICCCCCLRNYRKKANESKKALVKELSRQSSLTGIDLKEPITKNDLAGAAITTAAAARSPPQVLEINISTNGQPAQRYSLTGNELKRVSGGADLGLGHLRGSGSVSTLDTSVEGLPVSTTPEPMKRRNKVAAPKAMVVQPRNIQKTILVDQPRNSRSRADSAC